MNISDKLLATRSGQLNQRVVIRRAVITRDEELNEVKSYTDSKPVWASVIQEMAGYSKQTGVEPVKSVTYQVLLRYGVSISTDDLIRYKSANLKITAPIVDVCGRHKYLAFSAEELREV